MLSGSGGARCSAVSAGTPPDPGAFGILSRLQVRMLERDAFLIEAALLEHARSPDDWTVSFAIGVHRDAFANAFPDAAGVLRTSEVSLRDLPVPRPAQIVYRLVDVLAEASALIDTASRLDDAGAKTAEVMIRAALFHGHCIVAQPFADGNKRWARLLLNALLTDCGFAPGTRFDPERKAAYLGAVDAAVAGRPEPLAELIVSGWLAQRNIYRGAR
jgi:fido (protein-threonine AMPylation protein)